MKKQLSILLIVVLLLQSCVTNKSLMKQLVAVGQEVSLARQEVKVVRNGQVRVDSLYRAIFQVSVNANIKENDKTFQGISDADLMREIRSILGPIPDKPKR